MSVVFVAYLLGLVTLPVFLLCAVLLVTFASWLRGWDSVQCSICDRVIAWGPRRPLIRLHCRWHHGLALTIRGRVRRKQWHGLSRQYAKKLGVSDSEWLAAVEAHR